MADASFVERLLEVHVTLRARTFSDGKNTKIITGTPIKARIEKTGPPDFNKASIELRGIRLDDMDRISTLAFMPLFRSRDFVTVYAGDTINGMHVAFSGEITNASANFNSAPDVAFRIEAMTGYFGNITPASPTAIKGAQPVADFVASQAARMGYEFRNDGVTAALQNAVLCGSPMAQARSAAKQVGAELIIDDNVMILAPSGGNQSAGDAVLLNKDTGLISYPSLTNEGVEAKSLYNPAYRLGGLVKIESIVPKASGTWRIIRLAHELEAFSPSGGQWQSTMTTFYPHMSGAGGKI